MKQFKQFKGVYEENGKLWTKSFVAGSVYGERTVYINSEEYHEWIPERSKLAAGLLNGISQIGIKPDSIVLYLGSGSGTTPSHVSDIIGENGFIFALDFAPRVVRDLWFLCDKRKNMAPLLADANHPETYSHLVSAVDVIYMDVAQRNQAEIFLKNINKFLKQGGFGILCVKARSVDVTKKPSEIFKKVRDELKKETIIVDYKELSPYEKDHAMFVVKKK
ncbi:MAG: fibrillarin-like rRNA/tRNA 2'-O-methyltransferase [Candidatus Woesearchaeota archaeon]